ncbi:tetratricopeptide repeat protein [Reyranella aquatilis]|uniref:tetratricopeptide repeat protein n=1 Tax=Reyranella aquatilis TaxID=2035356 RepID=UPI001E48A882|nr:tetratricopeptide repeat protein [Reyranella aquatilis]
MAEKGNASAEFYLGLLYRNGQGVPRNEAEANAWLRKSADQGYPPAQYFVAVLTKQPTEAFDWYKKAAEQDYAAAQFRVGEIYDFGVLAPRDRAESLRLWRMAAERGYGPAISRMGMLYVTGDLPTDKVQAFKWLTLALMQPDSNFGELSRPAVTMLRNSVGQSMTPEQIAEAQQEAKDWQPTPEAWVEKWRTR